jgi:hypothetical protein
MKGFHVFTAAIAAAVALTSVAAAGPAATKQRVTIETKILPRGHSCSSRCKLER